MNVDYCLANANNDKYPALFAPEITAKLKCLRDRYKDQETHRFGYETVLNVSDNSCDIAHFKYTIESGRVKTVKAYLRQSNDLRICPAW